MNMPDLNLLITLDVLLAEGSVARAARRLKLSPSTMSRALARLRETTGDPLLVRAGRGLVPTPRAIALREQVSELVQVAEAVLRPAQMVHLGDVQRTFTLRTSDGFVENFGPRLVARVSQVAPGLKLSFMPKTNKDSAPLREGLVDMDTGVIGENTSPELRVRALFRDQFIGVVAPSHPLSQSEITPERYATGRHIMVSRRNLDRGPVDDALEMAGLHRHVSTIVGGFSAALALARETDLIATVPERHTGYLRHGLFSFALPVSVPDLTLSMIWHPRQDADPVHQWFRQCLKDVCDETLAEAQTG